MVTFNGSVELGMSWNTQLLTVIKTLGGQKFVRKWLKKSYFLLQNPDRGTHLLKRSSVRERLVQNEVCVCCVPVAERVVYLGGGISFLREKDCKTAFGNIASEFSPCSSLNSSNSLNERSLYY